MPVLNIHRGDIIRVFLDGAMGDEVQNHGEEGRPCVVVQNEGGNRTSTTLIVAPLRDASAFKGYRQQVLVPAEELTFDGGKESVIQCGQLRTVDRVRLNGPVLVALTPGRLIEVDSALEASLGL